MKKLAKIITVVVIALVLCVTTGCEKKKNDNKQSNPIVGTWDLYRNNKSDSDVYYVFNEDYTGSYTIFGSTKQFKYETKDGYVSIKYDTATVPTEYKYSIDNDIINIVDSFGDDTFYKKR